MATDLEKLAHNLEKLEKLRKRTRNAYISVVIYFIFLGFVFFLLSRNRYLFAYSHFQYLFFILLGPFTAEMFIMCKRIRREYKKLYNAVIVRSSLEQYFEIESFNSDYGIPEHDIKATGMIRTGNSFKADDYLKGKYKDVAFMQSDVLMEDRTSITPYIKSKPVTYFRGRWMIFEFNKRFKCNLKIYENTFVLSNTKFSLFSSDGYQKVEFENAEFNKHFNCYTDNQTEAFYLLTPHLIESIEDIRKNTNGGLLMCFKNNLLHVGVNCGRWAFEPPIFSKIDIAEIQVAIRQDINLITKFVDVLSLDENVYRID